MVLRKRVVYEVRLNKPGTNITVASGKGSSERVAAMRAMERLIINKHPLPGTIDVTTYKHVEGNNGKVN